MIFGIDVSSYQNPDAGLLSGKSFCIIKMSQGTSYRNPNRGQWLSVARAAGVQVGGYHFMDSGDATAQAEFYLASLPGTVDHHWLDVENSSDGYSWADRVAFILTWCARVAQTGLPVGIYMNRSWLNATWNAATADQRSQLARHPLWLADYTGTPGSFGGSIPGSWPVAIHQYSESPIDQDALLTTITTASKGIFMALSDDQQQQMFDRIMGGIPNGAARQDGSKLLDDKDGAYLVSLIKVIADRINLGKGSDGNSFTVACQGDINIVLDKITSEVAKVIAAIPPATVTTSDGSFSEPELIAAVQKAITGATITAPTTESK